MVPEYDEDGDLVVDPPMSRIEQRLARIEKQIEEGGGGGGGEDEQPTADDSEIDEVIDNIWGD